FVLSGGTYPANLGGLSAANAMCLNDLQNNSWLGRANANLNATTVKAFLCTGSTCNNLYPSTTYTFASASSPAFGGATFTTDGTGAGPGNTGTSWSGSTYFGGSQAYW